MTTHSSILAWKISWTEEPGGLQSMGSQRVRHNWATILIHSGTHTQYLKVLISTYLSIFILKTYQAPDPAAIGCYMQCGLWPPLWPWPLCMETLFTFSAFMLICFSHIQFCETLWTISYQAPLPMGFSRQEYWSGLPCPPPGDLPNPGIKSASLWSLALAGRFFTTSATWEALHPLSISLTHISLGLISGNPSSWRWSNFALS